MARKRQHDWEALVAEFEHSGLSQGQFAALHGLNLGTFRSWLYRLRRAEVQPAGGGFLEVRTLPERVADAGHVAVELPGGVVLRLGSAPEPRWVAALVSALERR